MPSPNSLAGFAPDRGGSGLSGETASVTRGRVLAPPASESDALSVAALVSGEQWDVPPGQWAPSPAGRLPTINAACLIIVDDKHDAWVPQWVGM